MVQNTKLSLRLTDVGGQKSERKKWVNVFHDIDVVVYVMSLSGYDQTTFEDISVKCYDESFAVFTQLSETDVFENTDFVVFLNKIDLFQEKLKSTPFTVYDPSFDKSSQHNPEKIVHYVQNRFEQIWSKDVDELSTRMRTLFFHLTCSLDTKVMQTVIADVHHSLIKREMDKASLI
ncbi:hypothetical protein RFI_10696 [Reticulomyxa filosa]|uniref:Uncharacterized protein n=1 Tax=Reticulomyxa filosa TaxID=46433 RepID=X6NL62_RETFI|nr:hypothetical protein RFI_10696 [Reticulomyxa filosa]|eukprot:ETO26439.1 hypothetical protein RFI_10696 [Reticulomyxa filosa]